MISVVDVSYHYGVRPVLRGINLTVNRGELVALMGPNGMGKSTLMAVIAGALSPRHGYVQIAGLTRRSFPEDEMSIRRKVFYLPAEPWLPPGSSGRAWLVAVGNLYDVNDTRLFDHVERLLKLFDLEERADSPMASYSTGQKKKIALCTALVSEAPIMLLDEPFSGGLDPSGILALKRVLQGLAQREDKTVLLATPVPELVEDLADRVAVLKDGQIIACATIKDLCAKTQTNSLADAYERLVNPQTRANIDAYLSRRPS